MRARLLTLPLVLALAAPAAAQAEDALVTKGLEVLLAKQEGDAQDQWPYEGVYRVRGASGMEIPIGYRIGGTSIVALTLVQSPGYAQDTKRQAAVKKATAFVCAGVKHPLMAYEKIRSTYDVRGWGYAYGLLYLARLKRLKLIPQGLETQLEEAARYYLAGIKATEIPRLGGWNYARRGGFQAPGAPSPFMTGSTLQALFEAKAQGYEVDAQVVARGLRSLRAARTRSGSFVYAGTARSQRRASPTPGATGRMLIAESTLLLAGQGVAPLVRGAVDAFFAHWGWLNVRRAKTGTHVPPFGIAPYYFYYAHYYCAQAIELLPASERPEYRRKLRRILEKVRLKDGSWNDRVFPRSASYGTAMALLALQAKSLPRPAGWKGAPLKRAARPKAGAGKKPAGKRGAFK